MTTAGVDFPAGEVIGRIEGPFIQWHVLVTKYAWLDYVVYRQLDPDLELARRIAQHGIDMKAGEPGAGKEFRLRFAGFRQGQTGSDGILDLYGYPTSGKVTFRPQSPQGDAVFAFFYLLVQTLGYSATEALKILERQQLVYLEIERGVISDPYNALPVGAQLTAYFPGLSHLPKASVTEKVDKSKTPKDVSLSGNGKETAFMDITMHETATAVEFFREEIDAARQTADEVATLKEQVTGDMATLQLTMEDNTHAVAEHARREGIIDRSIEEILKRIPPDFQKKLEEIRTKPGVDLTRVEDLLQRILDATQHGHVETRQAIEYQTAEIAEQVRGVQTTLEVVQKGHLAQTRFLNRKLNTIARGIEEIKTELATKTTGKNRIQKKMLPKYASVVHYLEVHPGSTLSEIASAIQVSLSLAWYYLNQLIKMGQVERQKGIPPQPAPAPKSAPADETEEFVQDLEQLGQELGILPQPVIRKKRGPRQVWLYTALAPQPIGNETPPKPDGDEN